MGWKERRWYVGDHEAGLFENTGNAGPTIVANGRVIGSWAQRADGEIAVGSSAASTGGGATRSRPSASGSGPGSATCGSGPGSPTPLERRLASG